MRYLISGYYGEGNLGDEAILAGILQEVRRRDPEARFTVLSFSPDDTRRRHGVEAAPTVLRDPAGLARLFRAHDLLISGGGSFLHEADFALYGRSFWFREGKLRPVPYFLSVIAFARLQGLPVLWYAQGLGPLHTATARRAVAFLASRSQAVTWRDRDSARLAAEIGVDAPLEAVVPDPAYALAPAGAAAVDAALGGAGVGAGTRFIAVSLRPWLEMSGYQEAVVAALADVAREQGLPAVFVPLQERLDLPLAERLAGDPRLRGRAHVLREVGDPILIAGVLGRADLALTMRLHAGILAAAAGTPAVVLSYDPKVAAFAAQTGQAPWRVDVDDLEGEVGAETLLAAVRHALAHRDARDRRLAHAVEPLRREAGRPAALAVQLAGGWRA